MTYDDYQKVFDGSDSYMDMMLSVDLKGGNKAKMNRFLQNEFTRHLIYGLGSVKYIRLLNFIKEGHECGEIPEKFIWNMLGYKKFALNSH